MTDSVKLDSSAIAKLFKSSDGPVARKMMVVGEQVKGKTISMLNPGFPKTFLAPQLTKHLVMGTDGLGVRVGVSNTKTRTHQISGRPLLAFVPKSGGKVVFVNSSKGAFVNHPGSDLGPYLKKTMEAALEAVKGSI